MIVRLLQAILLLLLSSSLVLASPWDERIAEAQQCGQAGDHSCAFDTLIELADNEGMPLADNRVGAEFLTGSMLEASLILASADWPASKSRDSAERFLRVVTREHPNLSIFYGTGHIVRALSCDQLVDRECFTESVSFLCENMGRLTAPMGGHPAFGEFNSQMFGLLEQNCGGS